MLGRGLTRTTLVTGLVAALFVVTAGVGFVAIDVGVDHPPSASTEEGAETESTGELREVDTADEGELPLADRIPAGERAVRIGLDETAAVAGQIEVGDQIDIWVFFDRKATGFDEVESVDQPAAEPFVGRELQNVVVLDVDVPSAGETDERGEIGVVVSLTPEGADYLRLVERHGEVSVVLRDEDDTRVQPTSRSTVSESLEKVEDLHSDRADQLSEMAHDPEGERTFEEIATELRDHSWSTPDYRTLGIEASAPGGPGAGVEPGDRIDLTGVFAADEHPALISGDGGEVPDEYVSIDLIQNVEVLEAESMADGRQRLAVRVWDREVRSLKAGQYAGELVALVRGDRDFETVSPERWTTESVLEEIDVVRDRRQGRLDELGGQIQQCGPEEADREIFENERAVAIDIDAVDGGSLMPETGDWIDVTAMFSVGDVPIIEENVDHRDEEPLVYTVLQAVPVLGVDDGAISVSVTRQEAHLLAHAGRIAEFDVHLRNPEDVAAVPSDWKTLREILAWERRAFERPCGCARPDTPDSPESSEEIEIIR